MPADSAIGLKGWRQGKLLCSADHSILSARLKAKLRENSRAIVISQSCDFLHESYEKEPYVEILIAHKTDGRDGNKEYGKNPRTLQFPVRIGAQELRYEANITQRDIVERKLFEQLTPDVNAEISSETLRLLTGWLSRRYNRTAFPDEFDRRLNCVRDKIYKALDNKNVKLSSIYIGINSHEELASDKQYEISLVAVMLKNDYELAASRHEVEGAMISIESILKKCQGIILKGFRVESEENVSLHDLRFMYFFDLEYMSFRQGNDGIHPPNK